MLEARQHVLAGHRRAADPAGHAARARLRRPGRGRRDRRGRVMTHRCSRSRACAPRRGGPGDPPRHRPGGVVGRGARRHGPQRRGQVHAVGRRDGQARLRGARRLGHPRRPGRAGDGAVASGPWPGCTWPCSTRPRCPACASTPSSTEGAARPGAWTRPTCVATLRAEAARIGFDERFLERPLNVDLSGGEKKRNETLQLAVLRPAHRHPRRARLRASTSTPCAPAPAGSRRRRTRTTSACWPSPTTTACSTS